MGASAAAAAAAVTAGASAASTDAAAVAAVATVAGTCGVSRRSCLGEQMKRPFRNGRRCRTPAGVRPLQHGPLPLSPCYA